ncbi:phosphatidate cytidylyltransferase [Zhongshania sp.]|uniref:phosphatidate cytidylyltransferase n=1 Tax=Zhongshania sp. TaxID=1971902 RepID=UPI003565BA2D
MLKQRIITAVLIVLALFAALAYLSVVALSGVFALAVLMAAWEWANLSGFASRTGRSIYVVVCALGMALLAWQSGLYAEQNFLVLREIFIAACLWWAIALLWVKAYPLSSGLWGSKGARSIMGLLVLVPAWLALSYLRSLPEGVCLILMVIGLVVAADVGAYFTGRAFGQAKLAPAVSPGKSWAGFWGGLASCLTLMAILWRVWPEGMPINLPAALGLALVTGLASVLGDLLESMIKRHRGIKDSGNLLPGHGGIMDRIDSITAAAPVFSLGLIVAGWV